MRSWLFTPGDRVERFAKALLSPADLVILDLEDAVAPAAKDGARENVFRFLRESPGFQRLAVRINPLVTRPGLVDLLAAGETRPAWLVLPKAESPAQVEQVRKLAPHSHVVALIESARGMSRCAEIAASGVEAVMFGAADYSSEHGMECAWQSLLSARLRIVEAATLAGVPAIDAPCFSISDPELLSSEASAARAHGFGGKAAIHPNQLDTINAAFSPAERELDWARAVIARAAEGVAIVDGKMVDEAVARRARAIIAMTGRAVEGKDGPP